ncbi:hypothetical protein DFH84_003418 [Clostridium saccharobutylicum]|nr:hypothetical protein [Clostridium saccharobutylicum]NOW11529.1 hypothetical protein [Clostridium saccharobutylicum]
MSIDYDDNKNQFYDAAKEIKQYVCKRSKLDEKLFDFTINKQDEINVYAFQLQSYIYYMRYVMLALDLMDEYRDDKGRFERTISHYIFNDKYDELKFEGLGYYYNIFWKKQNMTLFHCYDGCEGGNWNLCSDGKNFDNILKRCKAHIEGTMLNFYSSSKYFGRCMMKYFNDYSNNDNVDYNICIYEKMPVNYVKTNVGIVSLQEYQERCLENSSGVEFDDFSIDFSDFLKDRDDDIASLNNLFKKTTGSEVSKEKCGSIYDGEVIFYKSWDENSSKNSQNYKKYKLTIEEFYILMSSYFEKVKVQEKSITDIVNEICEKDIELQTDSNANNSIKIITSDVKKEKIEEILNKIDFDIEKLHQPKKENENYGIINDNLEVYINDLKNSYMR